MRQRGMESSVSGFEGPCTKCILPAALMYIAHDPLQPLSTKSVAFSTPIRLWCLILASRPDLLWFGFGRVCDWRSGFTRLGTWVGCVIHTIPIHLRLLRFCSCRVVDRGDWLNILKPCFAFRVCFMTGSSVRVHLLFGEVVGSPASNAEDTPS